jgi:hypothetical protein
LFLLYSVTIDRNNARIYFSKKGSLAVFSNEEDVNYCFIDVILHLCISFALSQFDGEEKIEELRWEN